MKNAFLIVVSIFLLADYCMAQEYIALEVIQPNEFIMEDIPDTMVCNEVVLSIQSSQSYSSYLWNTGESTSSIIVNKAGEYVLKVTGSSNCTDSDTVVVAFQDCTYKLNGLQPKIYPNPASDILHIESLNLKELDAIEISDMTGKILYIKSNVVLPFDLNVERFIPGIYTLKLINMNTELLVHRIIID